MLRTITIQLYQLVSKNLLTSFIFPVFASLLYPTGFPVAGTTDRITGTGTHHAPDDSATGRFFTVDDGTGTRTGYATNDGAFSGITDALGLLWNPGRTLVVNGIIAAARSALGRSGPFGRCLPDRFGYYR